MDRLLLGIEQVTDIKISELSLSSHSGGDSTMDRLASWANTKQSSAYFMQWFKTRNPPSANFEYREVKTQHMAIMKDGGLTDFLRVTNRNR